MGVAFLVLALSLIVLQKNEAHAQTGKSKSTSPKSSSVKAATANPSATETTASSTAAPTPAPEPAPPKSPWGLVFFAEYQGPKLANIDFTKTGDDTVDNTYSNGTSYAEIDEWVKLSYKITPRVTFGIQPRWKNSFDPNVGFAWKDSRVFIGWSGMINTADIEMRGALDIELPTTF